MGDRGQVKIKDSGVVLYTHWRATELDDDLKTAIGKKERWDDDEYLARIIFDTMTKLSGKSTGHGIGTDEHGDAYKKFVIDCEKQTISKNEGAPITFNDFINGAEFPEK